MHARALHGRHPAALRGKLDGVRQEVQQHLLNAATVDEISEGRFVLGIGTSGLRVIEGFHGREFNKPLTQVRDVIRVVRTLLAGERLTAAGAKLHDYRPFELAMKPYRDRIPIYVAALKEKSITSIRASQNPGMA